MIQTLNKGKLSVLISDKVDFREKFTSDKEGHYIMMKGSNHQEDIMNPNMRALYNRTSKHTKANSDRVKGR